MIRKPLIIATAVGLLIQLLMVIAGHYIPVVRDKGFAIGGMLISLIAGVIYVRLARGSWPDSLVGGGLAGGLCGLLGMAVSAALGDLPPIVMTFGTLASVVTGVIGAALTRWALKPE